MSEEDKGAKIHHFSSRKIALVILVPLAVACVEVYAHAYVPINSLSVVSEEKALRFANYTGTYNFSRSGCRWLVGWTSSDPQFGYVDIFKIEQNRSLLVLQTDLMILGLEPASNSTGIAAHLNETYYAGNFTDLRITYDSVQSQTYQIGFGLQVRVYERTLLGLIPEGDVTIPVNITIHSRPSEAGLGGKFLALPRDIEVHASIF
jgi:hypothetical protein